MPVNNNAAKAQRVNNPGTMRVFGEMRARKENHRVCNATPPNP
jgi:hypothetical protein